MTFSDLQIAVYKNSVDKGFWEEPTNLAEKLALVHSEVSEALEELRKRPPDMVKFGEELADVVIRVLDIAQHCYIDLGAAVERKHEANLKRPYKHGKIF